MRRTAAILAAVSPVLMCSPALLPQQVNEPEETTGESSAIAPLTGATLFAPGGTGLRNASFVLPSIEFTGYGNTVPGDLTKITTTDVGVASLALQSVGRHDQVNLDLSGGGFYYNTSPATSGTRGPARSGGFGEASFLPSFSGRRWKLLAGDAATYLPESANAFYGFGGLTSFASGLGSGYYTTGTGLNPTLAPSQAILTGLARRVGNVALTEVQYAAGERSLLSATGTYGILHFLDSGYIDNQIWSVMAGYSHLVSRRSEIGLSYTQTSFRYGSLSPQQLFRGLALSYGYRLSGKLAFQMSGGFGGSEVTLPPARGITKSFVSTFDSLLYQSKKAQVQLSFARYLSGGSGVLVGAETDWAGLDLGRSLSRRTSGSLNAGYQRNQPLRQEGGASAQFKSDYWQAGGNLNYEMSRNVSMYLNYDFQRQLSTTQLCVYGECGTDIYRHVLGLGLNLHARPVKLE